MQSPKQQLTSPLGLSAVTDAQRLSEEVVALRSKLSSYEESWNQAKHACEAWKREASEQCEKSKSLDRERMMLQIKLSEVRPEIVFTGSVFFTCTAIYLVFKSSFIEMLNSVCF